mmetsp:Transcript_64151/g.134901  ORF Transcript_64151/g.134901 Transcript_64151/m.134901 type:complete len:315 (+) Transcript_64151:60-1004(+)
MRCAVVRLSVAAAATMTTKAPTCAPVLPAKFLVDGSREKVFDEVFLTSSSGRTVAIQGLNPILPGHTVVFPQPPVQRIAELSDEAWLDLGTHGRSAQQRLRDGGSGTAFNWALKDGKAAGQPANTVCLHVVARRPGDLERNDLVYEMLDAWHPIEGEVNKPPELDIPEDDVREARTDEVMAAEANEYRTLARHLGVGGELPTEAVQFGKFSLKPSQVFFTSTSGLSFATVNLKPLVPGHMLVVPRRCIGSIGELTDEEMEDLWLSVRAVQRILEGKHGSQGVTLGLQDGPEAGQSVPHVHVHLLPAPHIADSSL